jgi:hypothetical protein
MKKIFYALFSILAIGSSINAQNVGIGTATPAASAKLDITDANRGLLIPRVALTGTTVAAPVTAPAISLLVYNTNTAADVTPGFYYWNGAAWVRFAADGEGWKITGNSNTTFGTNFLGTTNAQGVDFRTNNLTRLRIPVANQVHANALGTAALPFYSWSTDPNTGMYTVAANILGFSTNGLQRFRMSTTEAVFNDVSNNFDFRIESDLRTHMLFVDASTNNLGINTVSPSNMLHFESDGRAAWVTLWNNTSANGGLKQIYNNATGNGSRALMGVTNYNLSALQAAAVMGLSLNNTATGTGGVGVQGSANNESGYAVYGNLFFTGGYSGWAGYFNADVYCGGIYIGSDKRIKRNITPINGALDIVNRIEPVSYKYDTERYPKLGMDEDRLTYGFIAQDLETVLPELVKEKNLITNSNEPQSADSQSVQESEKFKVVNYTLMIPILTQAIKEQQTIIETQNKRIEALEKKLSDK